MNGVFRLILLLSLISPAGCASGPYGPSWPLALRPNRTADTNDTSKQEIPIETPERQPADTATAETVADSEPLDPRTELLLRQLGNASNDPGIQDFVRRRLTDPPSETESSPPVAHPRAELSSDPSAPNPTSNPTATTPETSRPTTAGSQPNPESIESNGPTSSNPTPSSTTPQSPTTASASSPLPANPVAVNPATNPEAATASPAPTTVNSPPKIDPAVVLAASTTDATNPVANSQPPSHVASTTAADLTPSASVHTAAASSSTSPSPPLMPTPEATAESDTASLSNDDDWIGRLETAYQSLDRYLATEADSLESAQRNQLEIRKRLLAVAAGKRDEALSSIEPFSPELQQFWKEQTFALLALTEPDELDLHANFRIGDRRRFAVGLDHLRQAEASLADEAALRVHRVALCDRVDGFGKYHEFPRASFQGTDRLVIYCEVDNFRSETRAGEAGEGQVYETELQGSIVILDQNRQEVNLTEYQPIVDRCRFRRRDFYLHFTYAIPRDLPAGRYFISVVLEDVKAKKTTSSAPLELEIR